MKASVNNSEPADKSRHACDDEHVTYTDLDSLAGHLCATIQRILLLQYRDPTNNLGESPSLFRFVILFPDSHRLRLGRYSRPCFHRLHESSGSTTSRSPRRGHRSFSCTSRSHAPIFHPLDSKRLLFHGHSSSIHSEIQRSDWAVYASGTYRSTHVQPA